MVIGRKWFFRIVTGFTRRHNEELAGKVGKKALLKFDVKLFNTCHEKNKNMISRIWHGYTSKNNADVYENLLKDEVFPGIEKKNVNGYKGIQLLRRDLDAEVEFTTIMWFDSIDSVKQFAGDDYETAYVPAKAREVLSRFDARSIHCEVRQNRVYNF